ncbi:MAG: hypothetical protein AB7P37_11900 [Ramlibacter sp.]
MNYWVCRVLLLAGGLLSGAAGWAQVAVSGPLTASVTWRAAGGPYVVGADVDVQAGGVLTMEAGTQVYMGAGTRLTVSGGSLRALGTAAAPVVVASDRQRTGQTPAPGDWGTWLLTGSTASTLTHVVLRHGSGLEVRGATLAMHNTTIQDQQGAALRQDLAAQVSGSGNSATGNTLNAVVVPAGDITGTARWGVGGIAYLVESGRVSVGAAPAVSGISPSSVQQGQTVTVTLSGTRLGGASQLAVQGAGVTAQPAAGGSAAQAVFQLSVAGDAPTGARTLGLLTDAGAVSDGPTLLVTRAQPGLTSVSPGSVTASANPVTINAQGSAFLPASRLYAGATELATSFISATALQATGSFPTPGVVDLTVRTPDPDNAGNTFVSAAQILTVRTPSDKPDLTVSNVVVGAVSANADGSYRFAVSYRVNNVGGVPAPGGWMVGGYLSADGVLDATDRDIYGHNSPPVALAAGASVDMTTVFVTKKTQAVGNYTIFIKADANGVTSGGEENQTCSNGACLLVHSGYAGTPLDGGRINEADETNNATGAAVVFPVKYDLTVSNVVVGAVSANADGSYRFAVNYRVNNVGGVPAPGGWMVGGYLSADGVLDATDRDIYGHNSPPVALAAGASVDMTTVFVTKKTQAVGNYTIFIKADANGVTSGGEENQTCSNGACLLVHSGYAGTPLDGGRINEADETNNATGAAVSF